jgi:uncharacterized ferritin-like protein (DUF455 family)
MCSHAWRWSLACSKREALMPRRRSRKNSSRAAITKLPHLLDIILQDEIGHVGLGDTWFRQLCEAQSLEPESTFRRLSNDFNAPRPQSPMNESARLAAGFTKRELASLLKIE